MSVKEQRLTCPLSADILYTTGEYLLGAPFTVFFSNNSSSSLEILVSSVRGKALPDLGTRMKNFSTNRPGFSLYVLDSRMSRGISACTNYRYVSYP